jgi:hypothetical protein
VGSVMCIRDMSHCTPHMYKGMCDKEVPENNIT